MRRALPPLVGASMLAALWLVFMAVPTEREMGIVQRIFYFHVASAWVAFLGFFLVAGASAVYLWNGARTADRLAEAAAEVGVLFWTLVLVAGPLWARPVWGVWWTWDPRLTMTVILWVIYASYLMLRAFGGEDDAVQRYAAVLGIIGVLDIPLIMVSVRLLRGIHPAVITRNEGGSGLVDPWMRAGLVVSALALVLLAAWLIALRMRRSRRSGARRWRTEGRRRDEPAVPVCGVRRGMDRAVRVSPPAGAAEPRAGGGGAGAQAAAGAVDMGHRSRAVERRLVSLERKPIRLCWTICAAFAVPVLATALIEHHLGHAQSARELSAIMFYLVAFGVTVSLLDLTRLLRHR